MNYSVYLHIPFCGHRCAYCDFNTYAGQEALIAPYVNALCREIEMVSIAAPARLPVHTIFFGGGTPSLLSPSHFQQILGALRSSFDFLDPEISIEANPGTVTAESLYQLYSLGINRISFGVQSANPDELKMLEREHDYFDVVRAVTWSRLAGFDSINLDLIYGLPSQQLKRWQSTVKLILGLRPEHISAYALTLEHGTPFGRWSRRGLMPLPDPDAAADMYEWASDALAEAGYEQYEISNWAIAGRECRHNLQYWRNLPYLAFGAGAHGYVHGVRYSNALRIRTYIERLSHRDAEALRPFPLSFAAVNKTVVDVDDEIGETMMTGLRLTKEGVLKAAFRSRFARDLDAVFHTEIAELVGAGLLEAHPDRLRLTKRGRLLGNRVFGRFLKEAEADVSPLPLQGPTFVS